MRKTLLNSSKHICYICGKFGPTDAHHIFGGTANRRLSEEDGMVVYLCRRCHNQPPDGVHFNKQTMDWLHRRGQKAWEEMRIGEGMTHEEARKMFVRRYGKNWL